MELPTPEQAHPSPNPNLGSRKEITHHARIGRNGLRGFWCGFCNQVIQISPDLSGKPAWDERFNHIDIMHFKKNQKVEEEWVVLAYNKTKRELMRRNVQNRWERVGEDEGDGGNGLDGAESEEDEPMEETQAVRSYLDRDKQGRSDSAASRLGTARSDPSHVAPERPPSQQEDGSSSSSPSPSAPRFAHANHAESESDSDSSTDSDVLDPEILSTPHQNNSNSNHNNNENNVKNRTQDPSILSRLVKSFTYPLTTGSNPESTLAATKKRRWTCVSSHFPPSSSPFPRASPDPFSPIAELVHTDTHLPFFIFSVDAAMDPGLESIRRVEVAGGACMSSVRTVACLIE